MCNYQKSLIVKATIIGLSFFFTLFNISSGRSLFSARNFLAVKISSTLSKLNISLQTEPLIPDETEPVITAKCARC